VRRRCYYDGMVNLKNPSGKRANSTALLIGAEPQVLAVLRRKPAENRQSVLHKSWTHLAPDCEQSTRATSTKHQLQVEWFGISELRTSPHNARTHSLRQIKQIQRSIKEFGFTNPVLIDEANQILAGHGRTAAAERLGWEQVPTIKIKYLSEAQKRAYIIADNQLAAKAGWDKEILQIELQGLIDLEFDLELTGFEGGEIDIILGDRSKGGADEDAVPALQPSVEVSKAGDVWLLGEHRLICADATDPSSYKTLLKGEKARFVFTDPPYNVPIDGNVSGLGKIQHREFKMASGEMSPEQFTAFLRSNFVLLALNTVDGAIHSIFMDWRHIGELIDAGTGVFSELKNVCVWVKSNGGMGSFYRSRHELIFIRKSGRKPHINNFELGQFGRSRTNVWEYDGVNSFGRDRAEYLAMHPTSKPVELIADAIKDCSKRNDIVLDPFGGSGSTMIACHKTGRRARLIEIDALYCDLIIRRWQEFSGGVAVNEQSDLSFAEREASTSRAQPSNEETHNDRQAGKRHGRRV
jgi:DNA modification methylase